MEFKNKNISEIVFTTTFNDTWMMNHNQKPLNARLL